MDWDMCQTRNWTRTLLQNSVLSFSTKRKDLNTLIKYIFQGITNQDISSKLLDHSLVPEWKVQVIGQIFTFHYFNVVLTVIKNDSSSRIIAYDNQDKINYIL